VNPFSIGGAQGAILDPWSCDWYCIWHDNQSEGWERFPTIFTARRIYA